MACGGVLEEEEEEEGSDKDATREGRKGGLYGEKTDRGVTHKRRMRSKGENVQGRTEQRKKNTMEEERLEEE